MVTINKLVDTADKVAGKMALEQSINEWQRRGNL